MSDQNKLEKFNIFVVRTIDNFIEKPFVTDVKDFVSVPIGEAKRYIGKREDCYIATDIQEIANQYGIKFLEPKYK